MKVNQKAMLDELNTLTDSALMIVNKFRGLTLDQLNFKETPNSWSILECIEHLNLYGKFYLPEIENSLNRTKRIENKIYKTSFLGDFFVNSIRATNKKKMKAPTNMLPDKSDLTYTSLDMMIKQLESMKALLLKAENLDLISVKTKIALTKMLKLRLGDTIRFVVYHNERHILQAERIFDKVKN